MPVRSRWNSPSVSLPVALLKPTSIETDMVPTSAATASSSPTTGENAAGSKLVIEAFMRATPALAFLPLEVAAHHGAAETGGELPRRGPRIRPRRDLQRDVLEGAEDAVEGIVHVQRAVADHQFREGARSRLLDDRGDPLPGRLEVVDQPVIVRPHGELGVGQVPGHAHPRRRERRRRERRPGPPAPAPSGCRPAHRYT